jgi:hypothetical protein
LGYLLKLLPDRAQRQEAEHLLTTILVLGRAVGICVIGALQDPRKEVLDSRDLWPTKVALRLTKDMTDLVLGLAWEAGARCDQITPDYAGAAFVLDEAAPTAPQLVRDWWMSDMTIKDSNGIFAAMYAPAWHSCDLHGGGALSACRRHPGGGRVQQPHDIVVGEPHPTLGDGGGHKQPQSHNAPGCDGENGKQKDYECRHCVPRSARGVAAFPVPVSFGGI